MLVTLKKAISYETEDKEKFPYMIYCDFFVTFSDVSFIVKGNTAYVINNKLHFLMPRSKTWKKIRFCPFLFVENANNNLYSRLAIDEITKKFPPIMWGNLKIFEPESL